MVIKNNDSQINITSCQSFYEKQLNLTESKYGHLVFKLKKLTKVKIEDLSFTVVIFNFKHSFVHNMKRIFESKFENELKTFKTMKRKKI